jgi:hypothetical protein
MKKRKWLPAISALLLILGIFFTGCPQPTETETKPMSSDATLQGLVVAGKQARLGVPNENWNAEELKTGVVVLETAELATPTIEANKSEDGAYVYYAKTSLLEIPAFAAEPAFSFSSGDYLYIEVFSPNKDKVLFYKIQVLLPSDNADIARITIGGAQGTRGTPAAAWNDPALEAGVINLNLNQASDVAVDVILSNLGAAVEYAKTASSTAEPVFGSESQFTFTQGDYLYIKTTSSDASVTLVYKLEVNVGNVATLSSVNIGGVDANMPLPSPVWSDIDFTPTSTAQVLFKIDQPADGFEVTTKVTINADAVVTYARAVGAAEPVFDATKKFVFNDRDFLYIKVASSNGTIVNIYRWQIFLLKTATIRYGSPVITANSTPTTVGSLTVDSAWDSVEWVTIDRIALRDSTVAYGSVEVSDTGVSNHLTARAKMMWDEAGVYLYIDVADDNVNTSNVGGNNQAWWDSVEFDINENIGYTGGSYETWGGLYRKGYGAGNNTVSGGPAAAITALNSLGKHASGKTATGYAVTMQVPWRFDNLGNDWGPIYNGKKIGLDIVVDDSSGTGGNTTFGNANGRRGVVAWNNLLTASALVDNSAVVTLTGAPISTALRDVRVGGVRATSLGTPAAAWNGADIVEGAVLIDPVNASPAQIVTSRLDPDNTNVRYARVSGAGAPTFGVAASLTFADGDYLYLEVGASGQAVTIYKIKVSVQSYNANVTNITFGTALNPQPEPAAVWNNAEAVIHNTTAVGVPTAITVTKENANATVKYTSATANTGTVTWSEDATVTVNTGDYVGIQVTSQNGLTVQYYKFRVSNGSSDTTVSAVTVAGREPVSLGDAGTGFNTGVASGNIYLTSAQVTAGRQIVVTAASTVSQIRVGTSTADNTQPTNWFALTKAGSVFTGSFTNALVNNNRIFIEITPENKIDVRFRRLLVTTANNAVPGTLTVGGVTKNSAWGTPGGSWNAAQLANADTITLTAAQAAGAVVSHSGGTNAGTVTYAKTGNTTTEPVFSDGSAGFTFSNGDYLYIKLEYSAGGNIYRNIYRIPIEVQ